MVYLGYQNSQLLPEIGTLGLGFSVKNTRYHAGFCLGYYQADTRYFDSSFVNGVIYKREYTSIRRNRSFPIGIEAGVTRVIRNFKNISLGLGFRAAFVHMREVYAGPSVFLVRLVGGPNYYRMNDFDDYLQLNSQIIRIPVTIDQIGEFKLNERLSFAVSTSVGVVYNAWKDEVEQRFYALIPGKGFEFDGATSYVRRYHKLNFSFLTNLNFTIRYEI